MTFSSVLNCRRIMVRIAFTTAAIVLALAGCGPNREPSSGAAPSPPTGAGNGSPLHRAQNSDRPEITIERISKDVVGSVVQVSELTESGSTTEWTFEAGEYRRIDILERRNTETGIDLRIFMLTRNNPKPNEDDVQVSGQLRLHYEWKDKQWVLRNIENLTFRYSLGQPI
jgi:hypothetical protein